MRLTCPNCAATYDLPEDRVPAGGGHVQCSACHTRWFARAAPAPERLSEDEIITRLETRAARPRLAAEGARRPFGETQTPRPDLDPPAAQAMGDAPAAETTGEAPVLRATAGEPSLRVTDQAVAAPAAMAETPRAAQAPAPILFPAADRPAPAAELGKEGSPPVPPTPLRPRQAERFETLKPARKAPEPVRARSRRRGRFALGLLLALVLTGAGLAAYLRPESVTARAPTAAPVLDGYVARVDAARGWIETRLGPLRDRLTAG
jgi:predicted Zn finger-like uncharacterized protein